MPLSQNQRVLALLRSRGEQGVSPVDFAAPNVVDGQAPIMRLAARIKDLRDDGLPIRDAGWVGPVRRYVLEQPTAAPEPRDTVSRLFAPEPAKPASAYDDAA